MTRHVALVTGASRGIGKAIALTFAENGYDVVINCGHREDELLAAKEEIARFRTNCAAFLGDVGELSVCEELFRLIGRQYGRLDVVVNNAGISHIGLLQDMTAGQWDRILKTNLTSVFNCCKLAIPMMLAAGQGKIVNISSVWGNAGASCEVAYSATKGGIHAFTRALAKELAPSNIQVNAVACGAIDTEMNRWLDEEERARLTEEIPAGRMGTPEEVADLVFRLCGSNSYLTGQIIALDGGWI